MKRTIKIILPTLAILFSQTVLAKGDPVAGEAKSATCVACHGESGISSSPNVPHLAGQYEKYIIQRSKEFQHRKHVDNVMYGVSNLVINPQDIADIAAYYASLPRATQKSSDKELFEDGKIVYSGPANCHLCHGEKGEGSVDDKQVTPNIIGQQKEYLITALKAFKTGKRASEEAYMMGMVSTTLTDEEIEALAEYLSSQ